MKGNIFDFCEKYRPRRFSDVLGNKLAVQLLRNAALTGRILARLFLHGEKGSGKNSLADLYCKSIICENFDGEPCGVCATCRDLEERYPNGSSLAGVSLYDCTKVDEKAMDDIIRNNLGFHSSNKIDRNIHIFDEFHRIRERSQDKLLNRLMRKDRDIFIFLLIDLSVVEPALRQRTVILKTERPETEEIIPRLLYICEREGIVVKEEGALMHLSREADRLPRECLKLLETFAVYGDPLTVDLVKRFFDHRRSVRNDD